TRFSRDWSSDVCSSDLIALMTYLDDASVREQVWRAYDTRASFGPHDNRAIVRRILELRKEKARLLGFEDFSDLVLADRMAENGRSEERRVGDAGTDWCR